MLDPTLAAFVSAPSGTPADEELARLLNTEAPPVIARVLQRKAVGQADADDLASAAREELIPRLLALRDDPAATPIGNFRGYVAAITYTVWAQHLRSAHPARSKLLNRLRYLLENRTRQRGFALWTDASGEQWAGFAKWRNNPHFMRASPRSQWLVIDPPQAARDAMGAQHWPALDLPELLAGLFTWLEGAFELKALLEVVAALLELNDQQASRDATTEELQEGIAHAGVSPVDALKWQEYLRWLWQTIGALSLPQRSAFLLHSDLPIELDFRGIAPLREIAARLEMPTDDFAKLWKRLPLDDLTIAAHLGRERQQVINLRRVARDRLGAAWHEWINDASGNKRAVSTSSGGN